MTMLKCRRVGNSLGVILPLELLEKVGLQEGDVASAAVINGALVLRPVSLRSEGVLGRLDQLMRQHRVAINELGDE